MPNNAKIAAGAIALAAAVVAAPFAKAAPGGVAAGYPDWTNVDKKHRLFGRDLCPSDLRHKLTLVLEIEPKDRDECVSNFKDITKLMWQNSYVQKHGTLWEEYVMPRDVQVVVSCFSIKDAPEMVAAVAQYNKGVTGSSPFSYCNIPVYSGLTFPGAPSGAGKRPFFYLMGPEGVEPLLSGKIDGKTVDAVRTKISKTKKPAWMPYFGTVPEPKHFASLKKALDPAKPKLAAEMPKLKKGMASKDPETAKEAQILYDAVEQARSDLVFKISQEFSSAPHVAACDIERLVKFWPSEKKNVAAVMEKMKAKPEMAKAVQMYVKTRPWANPEFTPKNAGESKKIVAELTGMKATLDKMAENSKDPVVQGVASLVGSEIDTLIEDIPTRVK